MKTVFYIMLLLFLALFADVYPIASIDSSLINETSNNFKSNISLAKHAKTINTSGRIVAWGGLAMVITGIATGDLFLVATG